ncbi:MAG: hypothetical protein ACP5N3_00510 [Candidatus Nanoarchaeia archaeon]
MEQKKSHKQELMHELEFCIMHWEERGGCTFGGKTRCEECAAPYLTLKLINGEILHGDMKRLTLQDWKEKLEEIKK